MRALRRVLLFAGFGLLPLWASLIFVFAARLRYSGSGADYWAAAPWLIVLAIPLCAITLAIAGVTSAVYVRTKGDDSRKLTRASGSFGWLIIAVVVGVGLLGIHHEVKKARQAAEVKAVRQFVEQSAAVSAVVPNGFTVMSDSSTWVKGVPVTYRFHVTPAGAFAPSHDVVVDVSRHIGQTQFILRCVITGSDYRKDRNEDGPCSARR